MRRRGILASLLAAALLCQAAAAEDLTASLKKGTVELKSAGQLAFGPEGILFVGDPIGATVYAIATGDTKGAPDKADYNLEGVNEKIAAAIGVEPREIQLTDIAANPLTGHVFASVARGRGPDAQAVILRLEPSGKISAVSLTDVPCARAELPNAPAAGGEGRNNRRAVAITDLAYVDGSVIIAGLSNEEFASTLRVVSFPFNDVNRGAGVEIFHGAHGRLETNSPVRTFTSYMINNEPHILAAYTCTPLVKFPLKQLVPGQKVSGVTIAELGNRNQPLDMFVYSKDGKDYILLANSARGVMKISTLDIARNEGISQKIDNTAGQTYETLEGWTGVIHIDRLNDKTALVLSQTESGSLNLFSAPLP